jgi:DNA-binding NtrC family response regulator
MKTNRVLIVSDSPDRRNFLEYHVKCHDLKPIWYPNTLSAVMAIQSDPFFMVIVDLSLPIEPKLSLVRETYHYQPNAQVITIEKEEYLKKTGILSSFSSVVNIDSMDSFPDTLEDHTSKKEGERLFNGT